jgi:hypothetical protein
MGSSFRVWKREITGSSFNEDSVFVQEDLWSENSTTGSLVEGEGEALWLIITKSIGLS